jgi:hypothetical protein
MHSPVKKWGCDIGQGADNTLSTPAHTQTLSALFCSRVGQCRAVLAHVGNSILKLYVSYKRSVYLPCLQIRLAQFDSGSRLQNLAVTVHAVAAFFSSAHSAHSRRTFNAVSHMRQGCFMRPSLLERVGGVCR